MKKILSVLVCVCVLLSVMVFAVSAAETSATITFDSKDKRTTFDKKVEQIWEENGVKVTNKKGSYANDLGDYAKPVRFYAGTQTIIEYPGMTKIEFTANNTTYANDLGSSCTVGTVSVNGKVVTVELAEAADSYTIASMAKQVRLDSLTVYAATTGGEEPSCEHTAKSAVPNGDETHKLVCDACSETVTPAVDCTDADVNGKCDVCEGDVAIPVQDPAADSTLSIVDAAALGASKEHNTYTEGKYYITGKIAAFQSNANATKYGNFYLEDDAGNQILIYGLYSEDGEVRYDAMETKPVAGDTVKLYGVLGQYNGTAQMKNAWLIEHTPATTPDEGGDDVTPPAGDEGGEDVTPPAEDATLEVVDVPAVGTGYKFGMVQGNLDDGNVYYLTGERSGYYMSTTTDEAAALDVYVEETDGGFYLYTMIDGVKTYINMVVSGTHVNGAYEATASTVYTYDETAKTMVATVNDELYWFATRNDNTYTTLGPAMVSYAGFYGQFYAEPIVDDDTTGDDTTTGGTTGGDNTTGGTTGGDSTDGSTTSPSTGDNVGAFAVMAIAAAAVVVTASKKRA